MKLVFQSFTNNLVRFLLVLVILYILFNLGRSIFQNYQVNEKINRINTDIADLQKQKQALLNQNLYYQTDTFKEIEARKKLGLKREGETMVIVPENQQQDNQNSPNGSSNKTKSSSWEFAPNYLKWWQYVIEK